VDVVRRSDCSAWRWGGRDHVSVFLSTHRAGIDGSPESAAATTAALELLGDRVGRLTLVAVTDLDDSYAGREERVRLQGELERQAEAARAWLRELDGPAQAKQTVVPELQLMAGRPATALDTIAAEDGYDLMVVGQRHRDVQCPARQRGDQPRRPGQRAGADRRRPGHEGPDRAQAALSRPSRPAALTTRRTCFYTCVPAMASRG
jgi:nucleotide-binding universal stress UspA family protein